ncbi:hypothetical protein J0X12_09635 [Sneathiella sp. CAU 1612]|uniref:Uncharacterized protein n=1 Tax=Sneathiella sedimenti TaxID=2816034 RepID=A0ABS3F5S8_9PROT|nr:hypothetical protein [Sneathiella sedimenti]MBO0333876.1 hypothetical protein [Sneathiella sedimenti]
MIMKKLLLAGFLFVFILTGTAFADVDRNVTAALADIEKYEQQFAGQTTASKTNVNRVLKLLKITRQRLDKAPDHSQPAWQEADQRYNALVTHMNGLLNPSGATSNAPTTTPSAPTNASSPAAASTTSPNTPPKQMISHQRVQVKKLKRDIESATDTVDKAGPIPFQDPAYVEKIETAVGRYQGSLGKFSEFEDDPDVVAAANALEALQNMVAFGKDHAAKELVALGDVQARLKEINEYIRQLKIPPTPQQPFEKGQLVQWLKDLATTRNEAIAIFQPIPEIKQRAYLPNNVPTVEQGAPYDLQDVDRFDRYLREVVSNIDNSVHSFTANLTHTVQFESENLAFYDNLDPTDPQQQMQHFLVAGRADEIRQEIAKKHLLVSEAAEYAQLLKHDNYEERVALLARIEDVANKYENNHKRALELVRMPKAATTDSDLTDIALNTLKNPKYDYVGEIKRLVINTDKVRRSKKTTEAEFDKIDVSLSGTVTLSGTETTYFYEWDQFQVATAEPVEDKFYIFYTTLKYYTSGADRTPLNQWIISGRIQGSEIPEGNINLD